MIPILFWISALAVAEPPACAFWADAFHVGFKTPEQVDRALDEAQDAFTAWRQRSIAERAIPMRRLAGLLRERADRYARLITMER